MGREDSGPSYDLERAGVFNRLVDRQRVKLLDAEYWLRAWEAKADEIGRPRTSRDFWIEGERWILGEVAFDRRQTN